MSSKRDYYNVLGVNRDANDKDIKKAYRKLALKYHPDAANRSGLDPKKAEDKFKEIGEAYAILSDPEKRKLYDQFGHAAFQQGGMPGRGGVRYQNVNFGDFDAFSIFEDMFGGINLEDLFGGGGRRRSSSGRKRNASNFGFGGGSPFGQAQSPPNQPEKGEDVTIPLKIFKEEAEEGVQKTIAMKKGTQKDEIKLKVPKGIKSNQKLRISSRGKPGKNGGDPGDLYLDIKIIEAEPTKQIHRIPLFDALLGSQQPVNTPGGTTNIDLNAGTQNGDIIKLSNMGELIGQTDKRRDLELEIKIVLPKRLTPEQRQALEEIRELFP